MYHTSSSVHKYRAQKDSRRADSKDVILKDKHKILNTSTPHQQYERQSTYSPTHKTSNTRSSLNYQNIIQQLHPATTKNSKSSSQPKQLFNSKKNDLLKQYLKNTIGLKKSASRNTLDNKENKDSSNTRVIDKENETPHSRAKYHSKIEAYLQNVKAARPQSAGKNTPKANIINAFISPKNNPQFQNQFMKPSNSNVFGVRDLNIMNNTTIRYTTESRDTSFINPNERGKSTEPTALRADSRRQSSNNRILLELEESMNYSPEKYQRAITSTNSRAKEEFRNLLANHTTKHINDDKSKQKYFKFKELSHEREAFEPEMSPIQRKKDLNITDHLNTSNNNMKDSLMRISKNLANHPYPTLIKQINLTSNTPTSSGKPPLYTFNQQETPSNKNYPQDSKKLLDYYNTRALNIQTTKENKKIEFPTYLQNYTYDRSKSKKDLSFNLEVYNQEQIKEKIQKMSYDAQENITLEMPKRTRGLSENHHDSKENIGRKVLEPADVNKLEISVPQGRYSSGGLMGFNDILPSKTPKATSHIDLTNPRNYVPNATTITSPTYNIGKQIDTSIKKITDLFANNNISATPASIKDTNVNTEKVLTEQDMVKDNVDKPIPQVPVVEAFKKNPLNESRPDSTTRQPASNECIILDMDPETKERKQRQFKEEYVVGKQIGQGAYACVRLAIYKPQNKKVAIKIYEKSKIMEPMRRKSVKREIKLMQRMNHQNIVKIYDTFESNNHVNIIMEYVSGMSLHGYLKSQPNRRLKEENAFKIFKQIVSALHYCHSHCIAHRDIKLENILLDHNGVVKIIDFGFSTCIPNDKKVKMFCGTPSYMAPEIVLKKEYCGPPADIWALGVLLYALLCGAFPFKGENDKDLYRKIVKAEFVIPEFVSDNAAALIRRMITFDPEKRPTAKEITNDPWYLMHAFLEKKNEAQAQGHRKSHSVERVSSEVPEYKVLNQNYPPQKLELTTQVNNYMKPPTSSTPTNAHTKINFNLKTEGSASKLNDKPSTPKNISNSTCQTPSHISQTNNYFINNKNIIYNINIKDKAGSLNKGPNETDILVFDDVENDISKPAAKKSLNETEIWGNCPTLSTEKSFKKDNLRGSVGTTNYLYNLSTSAHKERHPTPAHQTNSVSHYDIEIINNMFKMGYKEEEINQGLKEKSGIVFSVYSRLLNEKKALQLNTSNLFPTNTSNLNNSFVSPSHMALKKRAFDFANAGYGKNSLLDISGITNKDNSAVNTSEILKGSFNGLKDMNVSDTDIVLKMGHH